MFERRGPRRLLAKLMCWAAAAVVATVAVAQPDPAPQVVQIRLSVSNVFLIRSSRPVLVDAGSSKDLPALSEALGRQGLRIQDLALVVLTHAHSDHAGLAAQLQRAGVEVVLGRGDVPMAAAGTNDDLKPTNLTGWLLKKFLIDPKFEAFTPATTVCGVLDLSRWGIRGQVLQMPGHTPGASAIVLEDGRAFVGDMLLGGILGGVMRAEHAGEHYFQADAQANHRNIATLLAMGVKTFYLGHGGPVTRQSVQAAFGAAAPGTAPSGGCG